MEEASRWEWKSDLSVQVSQSIVIDCSLLSNPFHRDLWPSGTDCLPGNYCQVDPIAPLCHSNTRNLVLIRWMSNGIRALIYFVWHRPSSPSPSLRTSFPTAAGLFTFFGMAKQPSYRKKRLLLDALWLRKLDMNIMPISTLQLYYSSFMWFMTCNKPHLSILGLSYLLTETISSPPVEPTLSLNQLCFDWLPLANERFEKQWVGIWRYYIYLLTVIIQRVKASKTWLKMRFLSSLKPDPWAHRDYLYIC